VDGYQVDGNAATNSQFYATDSTKHFLTARFLPNFDSIMPAASYIKMTALARNFEMEVILIFLKK
jgi:hypothetical protein